MGASIFFIAIKVLLKLGLHAQARWNLSSLQIICEHFDDLALQTQAFKIVQKIYCDWISEFKFTGTFLGFNIDQRRLNADSLFRIDWLFLLFMKILLWNRNFDQQKTVVHQVLALQKSTICLDYVKQMASLIHLYL